MAVVQIADVYNPLTFARREQEKQVEMNAFLASGIMVMDPRITEQATVGGNKGELPFFKPLGTDEPNYSDDAPGNTSTPKKVSGAKMDWRLASQNQSWSTMDLARELSLIDPVGAITDRQGAYWATTNERRLINSALGILADNVANDDSDMVVSVATDAAGDVTDAEKISADVIIDARQTAGDHKGGFAAIAMHSVVHATLEKQQLIEDVRDADNNTLFQVYNNMRVVLDDSLPAIAGTNRITYTSILFGAGAWVAGEGRVQTPSEIDRTPAAGNGGGQDTIFSRRADIIHPLGFSFTSASVAGQSATLAELADDANWDRVWGRKNVPMAFIQTNG
jgi:hypothetical protein